MRTLTLQQVREAGLPANALTDDRMQWRWDPLAGDGYRLQLFFSGHWQSLHEPSEWGPPADCLEIPCGVGFRTIDIPQDGWRHDEHCDCEFCG